MATFTKYESGIEQFFNKISDGFGATDTWKVAISTDAPVVTSVEVEEPVNETNYIRALYELFYLQP